MLSIVVPIYNTDASVLKACLGSIVKLKQRWRLKIEIVCVDDGSTNPSTLGFLENAEKFYGAAVERLNVNSGLHAARRAGVRKARGDYVTFVDSDDILMTDFAKLYYTCLENDADLGSGLIIRVDSNGTIRLIRERKLDETGESGQLLSDFVKQYSLFVLHGLCIRRSLARNHLEFEFPYKHEDVASFAKLLSGSKKVVSSNVPVYSWRFFQESLSNNVDFQNMVGLLKSYSILVQELRIRSERNSIESRISGILKKQILTTLSILNSRLGSRSIFEKSHQVDELKYQAAGLGLKKRDLAEIIRYLDILSEESPGGKL